MHIYIYTCIQTNLYIDCTITDRCQGHGPLRVLRQGLKEWGYQWQHSIFCLYVENTQHIYTYIKIYIYIYILIYTLTVPLPTGAGTTDPWCCSCRRWGRSIDGTSGSTARPVYFAYIYILTYVLLHLIPGCEYIDINVDTYPDKPSMPRPKGGCKSRPSCRRSQVSGCCGS